MKRNLLFVVLILLVVALLAGVLVLIGLTQRVEYPDLPPVTSPLPPDDQTTGSETDPETDPASPTDPPVTDPVVIDPADYVIPQRFAHMATLVGDRVVLTFGGYRITFTTLYRLIDRQGLPALVAPDGSLAQVAFEEGERDVDKLKTDKAFKDSVVASVAAEHPKAQVGVVSDVLVADMYGTRVGAFSFSLTDGDERTDYRYFFFSDHGRFYSIFMILKDKTPYDFGEVMNSLEKVDKETDPPVTDPPVTDPVVTRPVETEPPVVTDPPGVILPPDDFDDPFDDPFEEEYQVPTAFKPFTKVEGDKVTLNFGGYRVTFSTEYQMLDLNGMPGLRAPDGSIATLKAERDDGSLADLPGYLDFDADLSDEDFDRADKALADYLEAEIEAKGGSGMEMPSGPLVMPIKGRDMAMYSATYRKDGKDHELTHVVFFEGGMRYTISQGMVVGSQYSFMDLLGSVEKA